MKIKDASCEVYLWEWDPRLEKWTLMFRCPLGKYTVPYLGLLPMTE